MVTQRGEACQLANPRRQVSFAVGKGEGARGAPVLARLGAGQLREGRAGGTVAGDGEAAVKCQTCGAQLEFTQSACARCGAEVELGRLTGILGVVCRRCDVYNEPGTSTCIGCGTALGDPDHPTPMPLPRPAARPAGAPAVTAARPPASPAGTSTPPAGQPVVRSFQRGGGARVVVPAASREAPLPLVTRCPRCGAETSAGTFCAQCGQALGSRGTQVMAPVGAMPESVPTTYAKLAPGRARLVLERGAGKEGAVFKLEAASTAIGRSSGSIAFPDDPGLAPHHATFLFRDGSLHVKDEGAPGGIHLRLRGLSIPLRPGDHLIVGDRLLRFAGPLAPPAPPPPDGTRRLGAQRPTGAAVVLEELLEGGVVGRVFVRPGPSITIGRAGCAVSLGDDPYLSQAHAEILVDGSGQARLRDLGSSNGTFARIPPRSERELRDADVVRMGREVLRVQVVE